MASPRVKNSKSASRITRAVPMATNAVEPHSTRPTTHGIRTAAVATRFQVIEKGSPDESLVPSHHIKGNKSRGRITKQLGPEFRFPGTGSQKHGTAAVEL